MKLPIILSIRMSVAIGITSSLVWLSSGGTSLATDWAEFPAHFICQLPWLHATTDVYPFDCDGGCGMVCANTLAEASPTEPVGLRDSASSGDYSGCWNDDAARLGYIDEDMGLAPDFDYGFPRRPERITQAEESVVAAEMPSVADHAAAPNVNPVDRPICETAVPWFNVWQIVSSLLEEQSAQHEVVVDTIADLTAPDRRVSGQNIVVELNDENDGLLLQDQLPQQNVAFAEIPFDDLNTLADALADDNEPDEDQFYCEYGYGCEYGYECEYGYGTDDEAADCLVEDPSPVVETEVEIASEVAPSQSEATAEPSQEFDHFEPVIEGPSHYLFLRTEESIAAANRQRLQPKAVAPAVGASRSEIPAYDAEVDRDFHHDANDQRSDDGQWHAERSLADPNVPTLLGGETENLSESSWSETDQPWPLVYDNLTGWHRCVDYPCVAPEVAAADEMIVPELPEVDVRPLLRPGFALAASVLEHLSRTLLRASDELKQVVRELDAPTDDATGERSARHSPFDGTHVGL